MTTDVTAIELTFDLFDLPTAQHKAGLVGLVLQIRSMAERKQEFTLEDVPELKSVTATKVCVVFTERSFQALIDDLYSADIGEVAVGSKWQGQKPKRVDEVEVVDPKTTRAKKEKRYIYDIVQPNSPFLRQHFPVGEADWLKLWRDMIWNIPRAKPTTRRPFKDRAERKPTSEAKKLWKELVGFDKDRGKGKIRTCSVSSAVLLGAQAINAEEIKFAERSDHALLLHFWQLTVLVYVPQEIDKDGKGEFVGYSLAVPEVSDVRQFCKVFPRILRGLSPEKRGYRPSGAIIDIPDQAGLEFMRLLHLITGHESSKSRGLTRCISSVEFVHLVKAGNNVKTISSGQIVSSELLLDEYSNLMRASPNEPGVRNPLFRAGRLRGMLAGKPWYWGMQKMLVDRDCSAFIRSSETQHTMPWFFNDDARTQFQRELDEFNLQMEKYTDMSESEKNTTAEPSAPPSVLIHRMVQRYVRFKTGERSGIKYEHFKDKKVKNDEGKEVMAVPQEYKDARHKVASTTYLAMRSRRNQDFADYFTSTICSVPQFLPAADYQTVATHLLQNTEDVKTLTLLALSASS